VSGFRVKFVKVHELCDECDVLKLKFIGKKNHITKLSLILKVI